MGIGNVVKEGVVLLFFGAIIIGVWAELIPITPSLAISF